jgi:2-keto-4-pentenoate hydratase
MSAVDTRHALDDALVRRLADRLAEARTRRRAVAPLSEEFPGLDLAGGYAVQRVARERAVSAAGPQAGWKLGVTSRAKQRQVGLASPTYGFLPRGGALDSGEALVVSQHIQPRVEPEIAFVMGDDLSGSTVTSADVLRATDAVAVAMEVLDSRFLDYRFTMPDVVADNSSFGRYVVGDWVDPRGVDLRLVGVVLEHSGSPAATAAGAASLGHPAAAVAWLVRTLAEEDLGLREGDVVISGGLTAAVPVVTGDVVVATIDRLGSLTLACA